MNEIMEICANYSAYDAHNDSQRSRARITQRYYGNLEREYESKVTGTNAISVLATMFLISLTTKTFV